MNTEPNLQQVGDGFSKENQMTVYPKKEKGILSRQNKTKQKEVFISRDTLLPYVN